jgi:hypothetical protein
MKTRLLKDGRVVQELEVVRQLWINTRCPDKWLLIDMETGEQYKGRATEGTQDWEKVNAIEWKRVEF